MLADVPQMTWFANIKMRLWRFVDKMDRTRALILKAVDCAYRLRSSDQRVPVTSRAGTACPALAQRPRDARRAPKRVRFWVSADIGCAAGASGPNSDTMYRRGQVSGAAPARPGHHCDWADWDAALPCRRFFPKPPEVGRPAWYCRITPSPAPRRRAPCDTAG